MPPLKIVFHGEQEAFSLTFLAPASCWVEVYFGPRNLVPILILLNCFCRMMDEEDGVLQIRKKKGNKKQKPEILRPLLENESVALIAQAWARTKKPRIMFRARCFNHQAKMRKKYFKNPENEKKVALYVQARAKQIVIRAHLSSLSPNWEKLNLKPEQKRKLVKHKRKKFPYRMRRAKK